MDMKNRNRLVRHMTKRNLKKLSRVQLLEIMLEQSKEIDRLQHELDEATAMLEDRRIQKEEAGSIAEASLRLNKVFDAVQTAADDYMNSVRQKYDASMMRAEEREKKGEQLLRQAEETAAALIQETEEKCRRKEANTALKCKEMEEKAAAECEPMVRLAEASVNASGEDQKDPPVKHRGLRSLFSKNK